MWRWIGGIVFVLLLAAAGGLVAGPGIVEGGLNKVVKHAPYRVSAEARALHAKMHLADLHSDTLLWGRDVLVRGTTGHVDVPRLREGRFALQVFSAVTKSPEGQNYTRTTGDTDQISLLVKVQLWPARTWTSLLERALYQAGRLNDAAARDPKALSVIRSRRDLSALLMRRDRKSVV